MDKCTKVYDVFLGGECGANVWRKRVVPKLAAAGVEAFDPVVDDWSQEFKDNVEDPVKASAKTLVFAFYGETRAIASMVEPGLAALDGRDVVVLDGPKMQDGTLLKRETEPITGAQLKDINRGRTYLSTDGRDVATRVSNLTFVETEDELIELLIKKHGKKS